MTEIGRWFVKALFSMDHVVRLVPPDAWDNPSPCDGWTARHVVGHVLATEAYYVACIEGHAPPMDPRKDPDRHAGPDPAAAWAHARDAVLAAIDDPGVLDREVATFTGRQRVEEMITFGIVDATVHSWDLARAAGVDDRLDAGLARRCLDIVDPVLDTLRRGGVFAPPTATAASDDQSRLLAALGRRA
jgi:uncharacterized protein (TIGR03086 family)